MNKKISLSTFVLCVLLSLVGANSAIIPVVSNGMITGWTVNQSAVHLNYSQAFAIAVNDLPIGIPANTANASASFYVYAPANDYPSHQTVTCVGGAASTTINNVTINCGPAQKPPQHVTVNAIIGGATMNLPGNNVTVVEPAGVNVQVALNASAAATTRTVTPQANVTITVSQAAAPQCHVAQSVNASYNSIKTISNQTAPCAVNVTVNQIPRRQVLLNVTPGNTTVDSLTGITAVGKWPKMVVNESPMLGQNYVFSPANNFSIRVEVPNATQIAKNATLMNQIFAILAAKGCAAASLDTFGSGNSSFTMCTDYQNHSIYNYVAAYDLQTHNTSGMAQAWVSAVTNANDSGPYWYKQYNGSQINLRACQVSADPSNDLSPANQLAVCHTQLSQQTASGWYMTAFMIVFLVGVFGKDEIKDYLDKRRSQSTYKPAKARGE